MKVKVINEWGYQEALLGISLSYGGRPNPIVAERLAHRQGGHNKFLEFIVVWIDITAPRYWWQQFDTYMVDTTMQNMHTLMSKEITQEDFEGGLSDTILDKLNEYIRDKRFDKVKEALPESFLQRRIVCTNYKVLQNMENQRRKLREWQYFLDEVERVIRHPYFVSREFATPFGGDKDEDA